MMTALEERLSREGAGYHAQVRATLPSAQNDCKQRLHKGATPAQYQQWQQEAQALEAALSILDTLKGAC